MQICDYPNWLINNNYCRNMAVNRLSFQGLLYCDPKTKMPLDSWFFRDYDTLKKAADEIKTTFPEGAEVWDFACSYGEETISIKSLLEDPKYKVIGYDSSTSALKLAKKGIYTIFSNWYDSFLLPNEDPQGEEKVLKDKFYRIMEETFPQREDRYINNKATYFDIKKFFVNFQEKFFRISPQKLEQIDIRKGNINCIENYRNQDKVGAVFFRNALYQMVGNDLNETIEQRKYFNSRSVNNKKEIIEKFVDRIHRKLENGGIFVIGDHIKDHLFLADYNLSDDEVVLFKDTPFFDIGDKKHVCASNLKLFKESPLKTSLEKNNRFIPVGFSKTWLTYGGNKITVPTVWKKIR